MQISEQKSAFATDGKNHIYIFLLNEKESVVPLFAKQRHGMITQINHISDM